MSSSAKAIFKTAIMFLALTSLAACSYYYTSSKNIKASNGRVVEVIESTVNRYCHASDAHAACDEFKKEFEKRAAEIDANPNIKGHINDDGTVLSDEDAKGFAKNIVAEALATKFARITALTKVRLCSMVGKTRVCEDVEAPTNDPSSKEYKEWLQKAVDEFAKKLEYYPEPPEGMDPNTLNPELPIQNLIMQNIQNSLPAGGSCNLVYSIALHTYVCQ